MPNNDGQTELARALARVERLETEISGMRHDVRGALSPAMIMADMIRSHSEPRVAKAAQTITAALDRAVKRLKDTQDLVPPRKASTWMGERDGTDAAA
jgi:hypothetical protein